MSLRGSDAIPPFQISNHSDNDDKDHANNEDDEDNDDKEEDDDNSTTKKQIISPYFVRIQLGFQANDERLLWRRVWMTVELGQRLWKDTVPK